MYNPADRGTHRIVSRNSGEAGDSGGRTELPRIARTGPKSGSARGVNQAPSRPVPCRTKTGRRTPIRNMLWALSRRRTFYPDGMYAHALTMGREGSSCRHVPAASSYQAEAGFHPFGCFRGSPGWAPSFPGSATPAPSVVDRRRACGISHQYSRYRSPGVTSDRSGPSFRKIRGVW